MTRAERSHAIAEARLAARFRDAQPSEEVVA
jgi:hypothetical protein